jgi:hypothetical protein
MKALTHALALNSERDPGEMATRRVFDRSARINGIAAPQALLCPDDVRRAFGVVSLVRRRPKVIASEWALGAMPRPQHARRDFDNSGKGGRIAN